MEWVKTKSRYLWIGVTMFGIGFGVIWLTDYVGHTDAIEAYKAGARRSDVGESFVLVYIFSSFCAACNDEEMPFLVERAKTALSDMAEGDGVAIHVIAASTDPFPGSAIEYLSGFGEFDEVVAGGGWVNTGLLRYIWNEHAGTPEVPQLLVLKRRMNEQRGAIYKGGGRDGRRTSSGKGGNRTVAAGGNADGPSE